MSDCPKCHRHRLTKSVAQCPACASANTRPSALSGLVDLAEAEDNTIAQAVATERAALRKWLGQQAVKAERESRGFGDKAVIAAGKRAAFKQAADHLNPARKVTK